MFSSTRSARPSRIGHVQRALALDPGQRADTRASRSLVTSSLPRLALGEGGADVERREHPVDVVLVACRSGRSQPLQRGDIRRRRSGPKQP